MSDNSFKLRVGELTGREDFGRGIARIDSNNMKKLGVREGDVLELEGKRKTGVIVVRSYPADVGRDFVRVDGLVRRNAGASIGETISVRKADVKEAKLVKLAPAQQNLILHISPNLIKQNLMLRPMVKGDVIIANPVFKRGGDDEDSVEDFFKSVLPPEVFMGMAGETRLVVVGAKPGEIVQITESTELELLAEAKNVDEMTIPSVTYEDIGGLKHVVPNIREMIEVPLRHPEVFDRLGVDPPKGVLLHGPPGTGKTLLAKAVANESGAHFISVAGPEIVSKWYGGSEQNLRKIFEDAEKNAPSIIFFDEIDAIAPKREEVHGEVERRMVSQLLSLMDGLSQRGKVVVIAATNRPNALDPALRRPGRFDREIEIGVPDKKGRKEILQIHTRNMPLQTVNLDELADRTYGFVGADLSALAKEAAMSSLRRVLPDITNLKEDDNIPADILEKLKVTVKDFEYGLRMVQPSAMREVLVEIPRVKWDEVGGLENVKSALKEAVEWPLSNPDAFKRIGITPPKGVLMYGPPGCGKTHIVKALANETGSNFISIKGPEMFSKWVGESEKRLRDIFRKARQVAPAIVFFDEIDSMAPRRGSGQGSRTSEQLVSQLLTEMSGVESLEGVVVVAATNRPDMIDPALMRPGRFDKLIYVPAPDYKTRKEILVIHTVGMPMKKVDLEDIVKKTEGYSGADLEALVREAGMGALRKNMDAKDVTMKDFDTAFDVVKPSISKDMFTKYNKIVNELRKAKVKEEEDDRYRDRHIG
jgi:transitional endoplasmic reticulum ATPase